jgi:hypothetical protein
MIGSSKHCMDAAATNAQIEALMGALTQAKELITSLQQENQLLRQKIDLLIKKYFNGQKTQAIDPKQLELLMAGLAVAAVTPPPAALVGTSSPRPVTERKKAVRQALPAHLPEERVVLEPEEVKEQPEQWKQIGEEVTEELDWKPAQFIKRLYIRPKYVKRAATASEKAAAVVGEAIGAVYGEEEPGVVIAALPSRLIEKGLPGAGLLAQVFWFGVPHSL